MWSQPPPPGVRGPPPSYQAPPQQGSWDSQGDEQGGSALTSAVDMVTSAASGLFFSSSNNNNNNNNNQQQTPGPPMAAHNNPYQTPMAASAAPPAFGSQFQPPIQPTTSMLGATPRTPAATQQPPPIQVTSSLLSTASRRPPTTPAVGAPPSAARVPPPSFAMGGATQPPPSNPTGPSMLSASGPPPMMGTPMMASSGPPPMSVNTGPPNATPSAGPPMFSSGPPESTPQSTNTNLGPTMAAASSGPPMAASSGPTMAASSGPPMTASSGPPLAASSSPFTPFNASSAPLAGPALSEPKKGTVSSTTGTPSIVTPRDTPPATPSPTVSKPIATMSPRSNTTNKLPLPPPSATLEGRKKTRVSKFKLPPSFTSTTPKVKVTKDKLSLPSKAGTKSTIASTAATAMATPSKGPTPSTATVAPLTPSSAKPSPFEATPKRSNKESSPMEPSTQMPNVASTPVTTTEPTEPKVEANQAKELPNGWVEMLDEASGNKYYFNTIDESTSWTPPQMHDTTTTDAPLKPTNSSNEAFSPEQAPEEAAGPSPHEAEEESAPTDSTAGISSDKNISEAPLPAGWAEVLDEASGRPYYFHEGDKITTWERPVASVVPLQEEKSETIAEETDQLPATGNDSHHLTDDQDIAPEFTQSDTAEKVAANIDTLSSADTTMAILGDNQDPLPEGWTEVVDPGSGRSYYVNSVDNSTTWERPSLSAKTTESEDPPQPLEEFHDNAPNPQPAPELAGEKEELAPEFTDTGDQPTTEAAPEKEARGVSDETVEGELPSGWIEAMDPTTGSPYYFNEETKETFWEKPGLSVSPQDSKKVSMDDSANYDESDGYVVVENEQQEPGGSAPELTHKLDDTPFVNVDGNNVEDTITAETETFAEDKLEDTVGDALPPGWVEQYDANTKMTFYYNEAEGKSSWDRPSATHESPSQDKETLAQERAEVDSPAFVGGPQIDAAVEGNLELKSELSEEVMPEETTPGESPAALRTEEVDGDLPPGWEVVNDPVTGAVFYFNEAEKITTYDRPALTDGTPEASPSHPQEEHPVMAGPEAETTHTQDEGPWETPTRPVLPPGWEEMVDTDSGSVYYYNAEHGKATWDRPTTTPGEPDSAENDTTDNTGVPVQNGQENEQDSGQVEGGDVLSPQQENGSGEPSMLPPGWDEALDEATGNIFYFNETSGERSWDRPMLTSPNTETEELSPKEEPTHVTETEQPFLNEPDPTSDTQDDSAIVRAETMMTSADVDDMTHGLPLGWAEGVDEGSGNVYFFNASTGETSWERPHWTQADSEEQPSTEEAIEMPMTEAGDKPEATTTDDSAGPSAENTPPTVDVDGTAQNGLPPGWDEGVDEGTGNVYFFNASTGETSWERPPWAQTEPAELLSTEEAAVEMPTTEAGDPLLNEPEATTPDELAGLSTEAVPPTVVADGAAEDGLPPGWAEGVDKASENVYFFNESTGETSWERPAWPQTEAAEVPPTEEAAKMFATEAVDPLLNETEATTPGELTGLPTEAAPPTVVDDGAAEDGLPPGWAEGVDEASGNVYFFNSSTNETSWERPPWPQFEAAELPTAEVPTTEEAIEMPVAETGTLLNEPETATPDEPAGLSAEATPSTVVDDSAAQDGLPPDWAKRVDEASGNVYFFNASTNETSWEKPQWPQMETAELPPTEEAVEMHLTEAEDPLPKEQEGMTPSELADPSAEATTSVEDDGTKEEDLPPGWAKGIEDVSGKVYYFNSSIGETSWLRPPWPPSTEASPPTVDDNGMRQGLPPGWAETVEDVSRKIYYVNDSTGESSWERPQWPQTEPAELVTAEETVEVPAIEVGDPLLNETEATTPGELAGLPTEAAPPTVVDDDDDAQDGLPPGWAEGVDEASGNVYFFNESTGETSWERPPWPETETAELPPTEEAAADMPMIGAGDSSLNEPEATTPDRSAEAVTSTVVDDGAAEDGLPPGWAEGVDEASGNVYFYNASTGETSWEIPPWPQTEPDEMLPTEEAAVEMPMTGAGDSLLNEPEATTPGGLAGLPTEAAPPTVVDDGAAQDGLPPGWTEAVDEGSGNVYFFNSSTLETSWERPSWPLQIESNVGDVDDVAMDDPTVVVSNTQSNDGTLFAEEPAESLGDAVIATDQADAIVLPNNNQSFAPEVVRTNGVEDVTQQPSLPPGWIEAQDPDSGGIYYVNEADNTTSWERPVVETNMNHQEAATTTELPEGWAEEVDAEGSVYYVNPSLGLTQWEFPAAVTIPSTTAPAMITPPHNEELVAPAGTTQTEAKRDKTRRPGHALCSFGFGGRLCVWRANGRRPVEVHRTRDVVPSHDLVQIEKMKEQAGISGPLNTADEESVKTYMERKTEEKRADLLWQLIHIVSNSKGRIRTQNGIGDADSPEAAIVELMLKDGTKSIHPASAGSNGNTVHPQSSSGAMEKEAGKNGDDAVAKIETIQDFILRGKRVEAVEVALESGNYALALLVSTFCDAETYHNAVTQFAEKVLQASSPLHTIAMVLSGQLGPSIWSADSKDLLGSWRYHLAAIISNRTQGWDRIVWTLGTKLQQLGNIHAAHVCFMVCGLQIMSPILPETYVSLLGCDHLFPENVSLMSQQGLEAYERTEAYEWAKRRGNPTALIKTLQPYKLQYAMILADFGFVDLAEKYLKNILFMCDLDEDETRFENLIAARLTVPEMCESPASFRAALASFEQRLLKQVPTTEPQRDMGAAPFAESSPQFHSPSAPEDIPGLATALTNDSSDNMSFMTATSHMPDTGNTNHGTQPKKDKFGSKAGKNKIARVKRNTKKEATSEAHGVKSPPVVAAGAATMPAIREAPKSGPPATQYSSGPSQMKTPPASKPIDKAPEGSAEKPKSAAKKPEAAPKSAPAVMVQKRDWTFGLSKTMTKWLNPDATTADMGGAMEAYYDEDKKVWVFPGEDPAEKAKPPPPPPTAMEMTPKEEDKKPEPDMATDPLAAMMAPPKRTPASYGRSSAGPPGGVPSTPRSLYPGMAPPMSGGGAAGLPGSAPPGSALAGGPVPQFMVFKPSPQPTETKIEESAEEEKADS